MRGYDCGYGGPLKPLSLANWLQEAAGAHAALLGVGMEPMFAAGRTWMLSRLDLRMDGDLGPGRRLDLKTWPAGIERLFAQRCKQLIEPSSAIALATVLAHPQHFAGRRVGMILSGGNVDLDAPMPWNAVQSTP